LNSDSILLYIFLFLIWLLILFGGCVCVCGWINLGKAMAITLFYCGWKSFNLLPHCTGNWARTMNL
jgi:hypothetical protein